MASGSVLVVGETLSLGRSIAQVLASSDIPCHLVPRIASVEIEHPPVPLAPVIVVACNEPYCETARRWASGSLPGFALVVVGARDPRLGAMSGVHQVPLPLQPSALVELTRGLLARASRLEPADRRNAAGSSPLALGP
jgi:hypothetical protein